MKMFIEHKQKIFLSLFVVVLFLLLTLPSDVLAATSLNPNSIVEKFKNMLNGSGSGTGGMSITKMLGNTIGVWNSLFLIGKMFAYTAGGFFVVQSFVKMAKMNQPGQNISNYTVLMHFLAGLFLIFIPTMIDAMAGQLQIANAAFPRNIQSSVTSNPLFSQFSGKMELNSHGNDAFLSIVMLMRVVGFFAVIRSFLLLKAMGASQGGNQVGLGKVLLHFIPGVLLMYPLETASMFLNQVTIT